MRKFIQQFFLGDVNSTVMQVLRDDGLYRHLRFVEPDQDHGFVFEIITWPNHVTLNHTEFDTITVRFDVLDGFAECRNYQKQTANKMCTFLCIHNKVSWRSCLTRDWDRQLVVDEIYKQYGLENCLGISNINLRIDLLMERLNNLHGADLDALLGLPRANESGLRERIYGTSDFSYQYKYVCSTIFWAADKYYATHNKQTYTHGS